MSGYTYQGFGTDSPISRRIALPGIPYSYDEIQYPSLTASATTAVPDGYSAELTLSQPVDTSKYTDAVLKINFLTSFQTVNAGGDATLEGLKVGVGWVTLADGGSHFANEILDSSCSAGDYCIGGAGGTGTFTKLRLHVSVTPPSVGATVSATVAANSLLFFYPPFGTLVSD